MYFSFTPPFSLSLQEAVRLLKPAIASKQFGYEGFLAPLVAEACVSILPKEATRMPFNVDNVRVCKILGSGVLSSTSLRGMVFRREVEGTVSYVENAKVSGEEGSAFAYMVCVCVCVCVYLGIK